MTPAEPAKLLPEPWIGETLEAPERLSHEALCAHALQKMAEEDFSPPESWHQALWALGGAATSRFSASPVWERVRHVDRLEAETAEFSRQFFQLPPAERTQRWREIDRQTRGIPQLEAWLQTLHPGMSLDVAQCQCSQPADAALRDAILAVSVLRPPARQAAIRLYLKALRKFHSLHATAARFFQNNPDWQSVAPDFAQRITGHFAGFGETVFHGQDVVQATVVEPPTRYDRSESSLRFSPWAIGVLAFVFLTAVRMVSYVISDVSPTATTTASTSGGSGAGTNVTPDMAEALEALNPSRKKTSKPLLENSADDFGPPSSFAVVGTIRVRVSGNTQVGRVLDVTGVKLEPEDDERLRVQMTEEYVEIGAGVATKMLYGQIKEPIVTIYVPDPTLLTDTSWSLLLTAEDRYAAEREARESLGKAHGVRPELIFLVPARIDFDSLSP